jgi:hypothetical protein
VNLMNDRITVIVLSIAVISSPAVAQDRPVVKLSDWEQAANGTGMRFLPLSTLTDDESAGSRLTDQTRDGLFQYSIDLSDIRWADDCRCFRYYQIIVKSTKHGSVTRHKFKAVPSGTFDDQRADNITLTITQDGRTDADTISLPVASAPGLQPRSIQLVTSTTLEPVVLAGETDIPVRVQNNSGMDAVISALTVTPEQADLWSAPPSLQTAGGLPLSVGAHRELLLHVHVAPRTRRAISVSWPPTDPLQAHTAVNVEAAYQNALFQNRAAQASLRVPIRFQPNVITLSATLLLGTMLGTLLLLLTKRVTWWRSWSGATVAALLVGVVFELIGMLLVAGGSKFLLFGYSLDPWQTVPVALLGVGVGLLGTKSVDRLKGTLKWR